ncbi:hypothetical protein [Streptomyces sp. NPDC097619]|uniref:trypsin-like serine peptidase n=1 Tax=Streptomyces sp. NPDC097619 TaxID=3157228 RepID=UPI0033180B65
MASSHRVRALAVLACAALTCAPPPAHAADTPTAPAAVASPAAPPTPAVTTAPEGWDAAAAARFWTPARMADAAPATGAPAAKTAPAAPSRSRYGIPTGTPYDGSPTVGTLYYVDAALNTHSCTASVVRSPGLDLIATAAHCSLGTRTAFVPRYRTGVPADRQPYGIWAVARAYRDNRYTRFGPGSDLDFAFASVLPDAEGRRIEQVTGGNTLTRTPGDRIPVTVIGYPSSRSVPADRAVRCTTGTTRLTGYQQLRFACGGYYGGTSGSPFLMDYDERTGTGKLVGNLGGWNGGGLLTNDPAVSFSPVYGAAAFELYEAAAAGRAPAAKPPFPYSLGGGETWVHARQLVSGRFAGNDSFADLLVVWGDGEVTVHRGDGRGGFTGETRLQAPNSTWTRAVTVTAGEFTGGSGSDLVVRWSDGRVTLHADLAGSGGTGRQTVLRAANSTWTHAAQIAAGRWNAGQRADDLVVRWSDGEVGLYTEVGPTVKLSREKRLLPPNAVWKNALQLAGGDFTGGPGGTWDLTVRWADGGRTLTPDLSPAGIRPGIRLAAPSAAGRTVRLATAGVHTANGRPDDLFVLAGDGSLRLHPDTGRALGPARFLVPPVVR